VILRDTRKYQFFARAEISRLNRNEIWQSEWRKMFSGIHSITSACPFSFPARRRFVAARRKQAVGGASENYLLNRGEIKRSECCIWSFGTSGVRLECVKISGMWRWWSTWWCTTTVWGEPELVRYYPAEIFLQSGVLPTVLENEIQLSERLISQPFRR
jgi:hypothetical protein